MCTHTHTHTHTHSEYATDVNAQVASKSIQAIGHIAIRLTTRADICVDKLLSLLSMDIDYVTSETLVAMTSECGSVCVCVCVCV